MKWKLLTRVLPPLLCVSLCACAATPAVGAASAAQGVSLSAHAEAAASSLSLVLEAPTDWSRDSAEVAISITDNAGSGFASAEAKVGRDGSWRDITDALRQSGSQYTGTVEVSDNGPVAVKVTGHDGTVQEQSCDVTCMDRTAPTVRAVLDGGKLCIEARDNRSGIASILVDGKEYAASDEKTMSVTVDKLDAGKEQVTVQAVDKAGNRSAVTTVDNPNYQPPKEDTEPEADTPAPSPTPTPVVTTPPASTTTKPSGTPQQPGSSQQVNQPNTSTAENTGASTSKGTSVSASADPETEDADTTPRGENALTPDGQGTVVDNADEAAGKEFFTITTADDNIFYLIIDRQRDSENVYFLNAVTEEDLLALAEPSEDGGESAVPDPEPVCTCEVKCEAGVVDTDCPVCTLSLEDCAGEAPAPAEESPAEPEQESSGAGLYVVIALVALAVGGAGYYFKIYKPKHELDDAEDLDELTGVEEETVNEDEMYPDEPDYPDYYDDEPEEPDDTTK